jgi:hypothetical protein
MALAPVLAAFLLAHPAAAQRPGPGAPGTPIAIPTTNVVLYHWPGAERLAQQTLAPPGVLAPLPGLPADILEQSPPIRVYLAPDAARFDSLTGGRTPDWGAGVAFPDSGVIVLPGYASERVLTRDLSRVLRHELAHVALQRYLGAARVPRWFTEGYATWAAGQLDTDAAWLLRVAFLMQRAPPLDSLVLDWPRGQADARIAYLLSASAIEYLVENGGERALTLFLERWRESGDFDAALRDTYGLTFGQLERYWGRAVRRRYGWMLFLAQSAVLWMIAGAIVVALYVIRRRRNRARLARLRASEIPDRPAYWLGEETGPTEDGEDAGGGGTGQSGSP